MFSLQFSRTDKLVKNTDAGRTYFKCKQCYVKIWERRIALHHTKLHPDVPHHLYLDTYFDLDKPLRKCEFCSVKLRLKRLSKHRQRAHPTMVRSVKGNFVPMSYNDVKKARFSKVIDVVDLSSDSDMVETVKINLVEKAVQCEEQERVNTTFADKAVQYEVQESMETNGIWRELESIIVEQTQKQEQEQKQKQKQEPVQIENVFGDDCENLPTVRSVGDLKSTIEIGTQTSMEREQKQEPEQNPPKKERTSTRMKRMQLCLELDEDGFADLVLF